MDRLSLNFGDVLSVNQGWMNFRNTRLSQVLLDAALRLRKGADYEWGHVGRCNCGHVAQSVTRLSDRQIFQHFDDHLDEWSEHANDYCGTTGTRTEQLFAALAAVGIERSDVRHLEYLSDDRVLDRLPSGKRYLRHNVKEDVILYLETMATLSD